MSGYERSAFLYDAFDRKDNVGFFLRYAVRAGAALDIGAGTGRIAIPLAERNVHVTCIEPSPAMRCQFLRKLERRPHLRRWIELVPGDAASFDFQRTFPLAIVSGVLDHLVDREQRLLSLTNVGRHLELGGILLFDVFLGLMESSPPSPAGRCQRGDREYRRFVSRHELPDQRVRVALVFEAYSNAILVDRIEEESIVAVTTRREIHDMLQRVGFSVRAEFSDYNLSPYQRGDDLLIVEAVHQP